MAQLFGVSDRVSPSVDRPSLGEAEVDQLKRRSVLKIVGVTLVAIASGVGFGLFLGVPAGIVTGFILGVVPHFTPWSGMRIFWMADEITAARLQKIRDSSNGIDDCDFSVASQHEVESSPRSAPASRMVTGTDVVNGGGSVSIVHNAFMSEYRKRTDPTEKAELLELYKQHMLGALSEGTKEAILAGITVITGAKVLGDEAKVAFVGAVVEAAQERQRSYSATVEAGRPGAFCGIGRWVRSLAGWISQ
jgi:hypothetical protein